MKEKSYKTYTSGLYYKIFMIVIYDRNDSSQYYNTVIMTVSFSLNLTLALASVINYDRKWCSKLKCNLRSKIYYRKTFIVQATGRFVNHF
jgi:hypothetical protein